MDKYNFQKLIEDNPELRCKLFARGFLFTDATVDCNDYPFYGLWNIISVKEKSLLVSPEQHVHSIQHNDKCFLLIGHAYNPFKKIGVETDILSILCKSYSTETIKKPSSLFWREINELTGVFTIIVVDKSEVYVIGDASGMQTVFYTLDTDNIYVSSHTNLIGDLLDLKWDPYVKELAEYRFFKLLGNALPGDLTQFKNVKRLIPNHYLHFLEDHHLWEKRFYWPHKLDMTEEEIVDRVSTIMHSNMELISRKWSKPAISMTGGCDSKTTLACANGLYDKFSFFSYVSSEAEKVDALAAKHICDDIGIQHKIYFIPDNNEDVYKYKETSEIINWNTGNIRYSNPNDVRKRSYFAELSDFDVEVKSWASEIGRAYYSKRFHGRKKFGDKPTGRKCTTLYKFFFHNRKLVRKTDRIFDVYLRKHFKQSCKNPLEWQEQFFWEFRVPSWNGLVITGEHRYSFDITVPYNNRKLLELLLSAPIDDRIRDKVYKDIRNKMNASIDQTGISVTNLKHTRNREIAENIYYILHGHICF